MDFKGDMMSQVEAAPSDLSGLPAGGREGQEAHCRCDPGWSTARLSGPSFEDTLVLRGNASFVSTAAYRGFT